MKTKEQIMDMARRELEKMTALVSYIQEEEEPVADTLHDWPKRAKRAEKVQRWLSAAIDKEAV